MINREQTDSRIMLKEQNGRFYIKEMQNGTDLETAWTRISKAEYNSMIDPDMIQSMYLDYVNNFLSVQRFAEYYDITVEDANEVINRGRMINNAE